MAKRLILSVAVVALFLLTSLPASAHRYYSDGFRSQLRFRSGDFSLDLRYNSPYYYDDYTHYRDGYYGQYYRYPRANVYGIPYNFGYYPEWYDDLPYSNAYRRNIWNFPGFIVIDPGRRDYYIDY